MISKTFVIPHRICLLVLLLSQLALAQPAPSADWAVVVHGGAGANAESMTAEELAAVEKALEGCLREASAFLQDGGSALDCVELVVRKLEDDPSFNAGRGAVFNSRGEHELDASIMDGRDLSCGAVAGVRTVKNPVSLARLVMSKTRHILLAGDGAEEFAEENGVERVENSYFSTPARRADWERKQRYTKGTVGCVVRDIHGNLAAATSTGGLTNKKWGRVGDSPILGAGCYADNRTCAVSCTGTGEEFIRRAVAFDLGARIRYGSKTLEAAAAETLAALPDNCGGFIAVDKDGRVVLPYNTPGMSRGWATSSGEMEWGVGQRLKSLVGK